MTARMLRRFGAAAIVLAAIAPVAAQSTQDKAAPLNVTGKWPTTLEMSVGNASVMLEFTQDGEKLTGFYTSNRYGKAPLAGTVKGRVLDFTVTINTEGAENKMHFTGEADATGLVIKGSADLGGIGEAGWMAKREKS